MESDVAGGATRQVALPATTFFTPIGCYNPAYGVTLSLPSIVGQNGVQSTLEPDMIDEERQGLQRSADAIKAAVSRLKLRAA